MESALAELSPALLEAAADASPTDASAAVVEGEGTVLSIPRDPADGVELTEGGTSVSIGLPELDSASTAVTLESGAITWAPMVPL